MTSITFVQNASLFIPLDLKDSEGNLIETIDIFNTYSLPLPFSATANTVYHLVSDLFGIDVTFTLDMNGEVVAVDNDDQFNVFLEFNVQNNPSPSTFMQKTNLVIINDYILFS